MRNFHIPLNEGDWVSGKTANDEKFRGFVERIDHEAAYAAVHVLQSDHTAIVGRTVDAPFVAIEPLAAEGPRTETELRAIIDIALQTRDREWFDELGRQLAEVTEGSPGTRGSRPERGGSPFRSRVS
ncbi:hypothetical protein ACFFK0_04375 [Paenibacillus chartarius]|uniref:IDEAL domain-containing protein n=1 Tax=Paenibacillus chartarius TaxID=747481 RepID=A0ABV6DGD3_9BACL